ncbi:MAG: flagellar basal body protein FliL, partial [Phenylobacterium sp.]
MAEDKVQEASPEEEGAEGEEGEAPPAKKGLSKKMMLIGGAAALVIVLGGGGAAFILLKPKPDAAHADKGHKGKKEEKKGEKKGEKGAVSQVREGPDGVLFYTMPDVVVNMQTADGRPTFLKLKLTLELPDQASVD